MKNRAGKAVSSYGLILVIVMLISALSPALIAARATTTMVSIPEMTKPAGSYATLPVTIHGVQNYGTGTISITYNPSVVHVTGAADGPESTVTSWNVDNTTGIVRISAWNIAGVSGDLVFANIDFKLVGSAGLSSPLKLNVTTLKDTSYNDIPLLVTNGTVNIETGGDGGTSTSISTPAPTSTSTPTLSPTPTPSLTPTSTSTPTTTTTPPSALSPTPLPTEPGEAKTTLSPTVEEPGFESIFACVALLIASLFLLRTRKRGGDLP